ncbi:TonB-dependent receptor plug domain-containing protein [Brevundimonas variabilis]|uniref:TonB-dependent receptor n=1 Tax=Brevundimonas variabilis TaxID=74312 RepID=A0A7W9CJB8_9CAUL|nr:TonB-dependent receptor [Brevundimonas variabilis]MBB5746662.1 hypothetical protein [Brevundimonas variabilis]
MMTKTLLLATSAILFASPALAQVAPSPTAPPAPVAEEGLQGVLVFTPDFFADQRPNSALDMVNRVPGFSVSDGEGSRGFEGSVGNVLINGARPASKNDTGSAVLSRTVAANVDRIELIRGGAPGIDMQGFAVVVNVITRSQSSSESIVEGTAFIFAGAPEQYNGSYRFTAKQGDRTWGFTLSDGVAINDSAGVGRSIRADGTGRVLRDESYFNNSRGGGQAIRGNFATPLAGGKIDLTARYGLNDYEQVDRLTNPTTLRESLYAEDGSSGEFGAVFTRPMGTRFSSETRFIHEFSDFDSVSTSRGRVGANVSPDQQFEAFGNSSETILRSLVRFEKSPAITLEAGGEVAYNMLEVDQSFSIDGVSVPLPSASITVEETRGEAFVKGTWRLRPNLTVEGGIRLEGSTITQSGDADQEKSFFFAKPRLQATWTPMPNNQVRFRFERELGQLDFGDFAASSDLEDDTVFGGNVDLEPEQRWIAELTYERRFLGEGIVSVGYRHDEIIDVIDRLPLDGGLSAVGNIGNGTLDRLDVNIVLPMDKVGFTGGKIQLRNTWDHTEVTDPTTGETRPISGVRASQPAFIVSQDITSWKLQWELAYLPRLSETSYDPDQTSSFRGRDYFEGAIEYKPTSTLAIRAQMNVWDDFETERVVYADRTTRPVAFIERRTIDPRTFYQIRVRKTF